MKYHFIFLMIIAGVLSSCTDLDDEPAVYEIYEEYNLLFNWGEMSNHYYKRHIINYFSSIALGSEYGSDLPILRRWSEPMKIYVSGQPDDMHLEEVYKVVTDINNLVVDNFQLEVVSDPDIANMTIFFGSRQEYISLFPEALRYIGDNSGFFMTFHDDQFKIHSGHAFISLEETSVSNQLHITREELTQALGLANDIPYYPNSIFYESPSTTTEYSDLDKEVIRLLYHPKLVPGLGRESVENVLKRLLGVE